MVPKEIPTGRLYATIGLGTTGTKGIASFRMQNRSIAPLLIGSTVFIDEEGVSIRHSEILLSFVINANQDRLEQIARQSNVHTFWSLTGSDREGTVMKSVTTRL